MTWVTGIGGFFFRAADPSRIARWYFDCLGVTLPPTTYEEPVWTQEAGHTVFHGFPKDTKYFGRAEQQWMINFRVRDLDALVAHLRTLGNDVDVDATVYPNGRFALVHDPEGNPVQLWEPAATAASPPPSGPAAG
jgi:predicted enzyme related to lactoylglutathione lyase